MYLYHGTTWAFIVVQNTKRFFAGDCIVVQNIKCICITVVEQGLVL